jgi:hypothetical protein
MYAPDGTGSVADRAAPRCQVATADGSTAYNVRMLKRRWVRWVLAACVVVAVAFAGLVAWAGADRAAAVAGYEALVPGMTAAQADEVVARHGRCRPARPTILQWPSPADLRTWRAGPFEVSAIFEPDPDGPARTLSIKWLEQEQAPAVGLRGELIRLAREYGLIESRYWRRW